MPNNSNKKGTNFEQHFIEAKTIMMPPKDTVDSNNQQMPQDTLNDNENNLDESKTVSWFLDKPLSPEEFEAGTRNSSVAISPSPIHKPEAINPMSGGGNLVVHSSSSGNFQPVAPKRIGNPSSELIMVLKPDSTSADQFRLLRFKVMESGKSQIIVVTSPHKGDGKSVVASNLALSLSESGRNKILLIDCCLRRPRLSAMFGVGEDFGLSTELQNKHIDPSSVIRVIGLAEALYLLPAGPPVPNPTAILGSDVMMRLLKELRSSFDHIVMDVSSVLDHSDANTIYESVDSYIITCMKRKTKTDEIEQCYLRLSPEKILGVVFVGSNDVE